MKTCPRCGVALVPDAAEGLCPRCLLEAGTEAPTSPGAGWVPPTVESLNALFTEFEVTRLLGQGGMGAVYEARQRKLDRLVALKVLPPELGEQPGFAERLAREARALAKLAHPNVVGIHDFGKAGDLHYVVMEYVDGKSLRQLLRDARMETARAVEIAVQICEGLHYAHERGVIHRDIKPENILVDRMGRVRIADFGLAKLVAETRTGAITGPSDVMGTVPYMAPEQVERSSTADRRADLYALGVVLYEMLTGQLPIGRFPPPSHRANSHTHLDDIVLRLLEHDPAKRPATALEVKQAIEGSGSRRPAPLPRAPETAPARGASRTPFLWILVAGCIGFAAMFLTWASMPKSKLDDLIYGKGHDFFGDKNSPDHPFNSPFFEKHRTPERDLRVLLAPWDTNFYGLPYGLLGIVSGVLAILAGISLGSGWRPSWAAFGIPAGCGFVVALWSAIWFASYGGSPAIGNVLTVLVLGVIATAAWLLRAPRPQRVKTTFFDRRRQRRRRQSERKRKTTWGSAREATREQHGPDAAP